MLTILHPQVMPAIRSFPGGILLLKLPGSDKPSLIIKAPKEYILTAKVNGSFKMYLAPVLVEGIATHGVVTAFFDDEDQPLTLRTPLFDDEFANGLLLGLLEESIDVHFFDELSRERLVYAAVVHIPDATKELIGSVRLLSGSISRAREFADGLPASFGLRTAKDDEQAIRIELEEPVYGEDLFIQDLRPELHSYHGSRGFSHTVLEREEPGRFQEEDIIQCLHRVFPSDRIYLSPKRIYDSEEVCDILVDAQSVLLIVQAKDSPNIERISRQKLSRKRAATLGALKKALEQVKGAIGYIRRDSEALEFFIGDERHSIALKGRAIKALVVVKELFSDQFFEYSQLLLSLVREKDVPCVALDYPELFQYCAHLDDERTFFEAYDVVMGHADQHGEYPRLRFGMTG